MTGDETVKGSCETALIDFPVNAPRSRIERTGSHGILVWNPRVEAFCGI